MIQSNGAVRNKGEYCAYADMNVLNMPLGCQACRSLNLAEHSQRILAPSSAWDGSSFAKMHPIGQFLVDYDETKTQEYTRIGRGWKSK